MSDIKHQISQVEAEIDQDKQAIASQFKQLKIDVRSPVFLTSTLIGGVVLGFVLGNKRTSAFLRDKIKETPKLMKMGMKHLPTLLSLFSRFY